MDGAFAEQITGPLTQLEIVGRTAGLPAAFAVGRELTDKDLPLLHHQLHVLDGQTAVTVCRGIEGNRRLFLLRGSRWPGCDIDPVTEDGVAAALEHAALEEARWPDGGAAGGAGAGAGAGAVDPDDFAALLGIGYVGDTLAEVAACRLHLDRLRRGSGAHPLLAAIADISKRAPLPYRLPPAGELAPPRCPPGVSPLNEAQLRAILSFRHSIEAVQGPPGTGKSTTIFHILRSILPPGGAVLLTYVQNQAGEANVEKLAAALEAYEATEAAEAAGAAATAGAGAAAGGAGACASTTGAIVVAASAGSSKRTVPPTSLGLLMPPAAAAVAASAAAGKLRALSVTAASTPVSAAASFASAASVAAVSSVVVARPSVSFSAAGAAAFPPLAGVASSAFPALGLRSIRVASAAAVDAASSSSPTMSSTRSTPATPGAWAAAAGRPPTKAAPVAAAGGGNPLAAFAAAATAGSRGGAGGAGLASESASPVPGAWTVGMAAAISPERPMSHKAKAKGTGKAAKVGSKPAAAATSSAPAASAGWSKPGIAPRSGGAGASAGPDADAGSPFDLAADLELDPTPELDLAALGLSPEDIAANMAYFKDSEMAKAAAKEAEAEVGSTAEWEWKVPSSPGQGPWAAAGSSTTKRGATGAGPVLGAGVKGKGKGTVKAAGAAAGAAWEAAAAGGCGKPTRGTAGATGPSAAAAATTSASPLVPAHILAALGPEGLTDAELAANLAGVLPSASATGASSPGSKRSAAATAAAAGGAGGRGASLAWAIRGDAASASASLKSGAPGGGAASRGSTGAAIPGACFASTAATAAAATPPSSDPSPTPARGAVRFLVFGNEDRLGPLARQHTLEAKLKRHPLLRSLEAVADRAEQLAAAVEAAAQHHGRRVLLSPALVERRRAIARARFPGEPPTSESPQLLAFMARDPWRRVVAGVWRAAQGRLGRAAAIASRLRVQRQLAHVQARKDILASTDVVLGTIASACGGLLARPEYGGLVRRIHSAVIDEAGASPETKMPLLLLLPALVRIIVIGDHAQLPPFTHYDEAGDGCDAERPGSSMQRWVASLPAGSVPCLTAQHRMHPAIADVVSRLFYSGALTTPPGVAAARMAADPVGLLWLHCAAAAGGGLEVKPEGSTSFENPTEVGLALRVFLVARERGWLSGRSVMVITPYKGQVRALQAAFKAAGVREHDAEGTADADARRSGTCSCRSFRIVTADQSQGSEADVVIFSCVRSNRERCMGFVSNPNRLNVAISRARERLVIIGDGGTMTTDARWDAIWRASLRVASPEALPPMAVVTAPRRTA